MKNVLIAVIGNTGNEPEAIRQTLEYFDCLVMTIYIGRPNDFIDVLDEKFPFDADTVILSCHGEDGRILMPVLGGDFYLEDEPRGHFGVEEIAKWLTMRNKTIINLGCTTGNEKMAGIFSKQNIYIAPDDYVEARSALFFLIHLFYEIMQNGVTLREAYEKARNTDEETRLFRFFS